MPSFWLDGPQGAHTDGSSVVTLTPVLKLFGEPYEATIKKVYYDKVFFALNDEEPTELEQTKAVRLRCKFHLDDRYMTTREAGYTQKGSLITVRAVPDDPEYANHFPEGIYGEAGVTLWPCKIVSPRPSPEFLPRPNEDRNQWKSQMSARVVSYSDEKVSGQAILKDSSSYGDSGGGATWFDRFQWRFRFSYSPPIGEWATPLDQGGTFEQRIHSIDHLGNILFENPNPDMALIGPGGKAITTAIGFYEYDHWQQFYDTRR